MASSPTTCVVGKDQVSVTGPRRHLSNGLPLFQSHPAHQSPELPHTIARLLRTSFKEARSQGASDTSPVATSTSFPPMMSLGPQGVLPLGCLVNSSMVMVQARSGPSALSRYPVTSALGPEPFSSWWATTK